MRTHLSSRAVSPIRIVGVNGSSDRCDLVALSLPPGP